MSVLQRIASQGALRAAFNLGNRALVWRDGDRFHGLSPALAQRLADAVGASLEPVVYSGAGAVVADAGKGAWDVAFLAIDAERARKLSFTRPYHVIEATFAVRAASPIRTIEDIDRPGVRVLSAAGSAYDLHLSRTLRRADYVRRGAPAESFRAFRDEPFDAVAGVRASLRAAFEDDPAIRLLAEPLTKVEQAMALPAPDHWASDALDQFVARAIGDGYVASIARSAPS